MNDLELLCERLSRENEMIKGDLQEKKTTMMSNFKELEGELEKQSNIISILNGHIYFLK